MTTTIHNTSQLKNLPDVQTRALLYAFSVLDDESNDGKANHSQISVICQSIESEFRTGFPFDRLYNYADDQKRYDFLSLKKYLEECCLDRIPHFDDSKFYKVCWDFYRNHDKSDHNVTKLKADQLFKLWQICNVINDQTNCTTIAMVDLVPVFQKIARTLGVQWNADEFYLHPRRADFWKVIDEFGCGLFVSVDDELIEEIVCNLYDFYVLNIIKVGFLSKRGHRMTSIRDRYFILKHNVLEYYTENLREKRGSIAINQYTTVESKPAEGGKYWFAVTDNNTGIVYDIYAVSYRLKIDWIYAIQTAIAANQKKKLPAQIHIELDREMARGKLSALQLKEIQAKYKALLTVQTDLAMESVARAVAEVNLIEAEEQRELAEKQLHAEREIRLKAEEENQEHKQRLDSHAKEIQALQESNVEKQAKLAREQKKSEELLQKKLVNEEMLRRMEAEKTDLEQAVAEHQGLLKIKTEELKKIQEEQESRLREEKELKEKLEVITDAKEKRKSFLQLANLEEEYKNGNTLLKKTENDIQGLKTKGTHLNTKIKDLRNKISSVEDLRLTHRGYYAVGPAPVPKPRTDLEKNGLKS
ncbi:Switch-associated protein 70 [Trichoplax sp. H2]|uniref:PH domain-containing protein n=1 Tax=Trichoplax adhaerens TaxID=10228 RepID=B3SAQ2_TRIAD|nr:hypothetical protein TRIADDRAFT_61339 [Trichoplax adhaerens]EDV20195.1 hypothetical protein TRIADDRAFT_61339 [Trichoplax adhaerens]RDD36791.1 Switch-associated protein 70 [Trichoplax sp. H2]|eukprot:XP_002117356.1 hypothetical protein TRIADDRAFT_61339 [Trichoplax adhaerens]